MNISGLSIHFNYLALKYISRSFPLVQIILLLHFESLSLQTAAATAAHDPRTYLQGGPWAFLSEEDGRTASCAHFACWVFLCPQPG